MLQSTFNIFSHTIWTLSSIHQLMFTVSEACLMMGPENCTDQQHSQTLQSSTVVSVLEQERGNEELEESWNKTCMRMYSGKL